MMKEPILRILTIALALVMVLSCFSGCASISTKLSVNDIELDGDYLTPEDHMEELAANAPTYEDEPSDEEPSDEEPSDEEPSDEEPSDKEPSDEEPSDKEPSDEEPSDKEPSDEEPSDEEPSDEEPSDEEPSEDDEQNNEDLFEEEEKDYSDYITIASYNIKCAWYGKSWQNVIDTIKSVDPAIIGLQECDDGTTRSSATPGSFSNQVQQLANDMGYKYWYFSKTIETDGGAYGHGVMSKYPIKDSQTIFFNAQKDEKRNMERHVLDVDGTELIFYNTHLNGTFFNQFEEVVAAMEEDYADGKYIMLTGDFNIPYSNMSGRLDTNKFLPLNGDETFSFGVAKHTKIDNIIISRNIKDYYFDESVGYGIRVIPDPKELSSDHPMVYSHIKFPEK